METKTMTKENISINDMLNEIENYYEEMDTDFRFIKSMEIGKIVRQGDIYINKVAEDFPHGSLKKDKQLAEGTSTGSRHMAEAPAECYVGTTIPEYYSEKAFLGPFVKSSERFVVSHPEHADVSLPIGCYQVSHQLNPSTLQRVRD